MAQLKVVSFKWISLVVIVVFLMQIAVAAGRSASVINDAIDDVSRSDGPTGNFQNDIDIDQMELTPTGVIVTFEEAPTSLAVAGDIYDYFLFIDIDNDDMADYVMQYAESVVSSSFSQIVRMIADVATWAYWNDTAWTTDPSDFDYPLNSSYIALDEDGAKRSVTFNFSHVPDILTASKEYNLNSSRDRTDGTYNYSDACPDSAYAFEFRNLDIIVLLSPVIMGLAVAWRKKTKNQVTIPLRSFPKH